MKKISFILAGLAIIGIGGWLAWWGSGTSQVLLPETVVYNTAAENLTQFLAEDKSQTEREAALGEALNGFLETANNERADSSLRADALYNLGTYFGEVGRGYLRNGDAGNAKAALRDSLTSFVASLTLKPQDLDTKENAEIVMRLLDESGEKTKVFPNQSTGRTQPNGGATKDKPSRAP